MYKLLPDLKKNNIPLSPDLMLLQNVILETNAPVYRYSLVKLHSSEKKSQSIYSTCHAHSDVTPNSKQAGMLKVKIHIVSQPSSIYFNNI